MKVWVVFYDYGHDGHSEPEGVFSTKEKAEAWVGGEGHYYPGSREIDEFEVDNPDFWKAP